MFMREMKFPENASAPPHTQAPQILDTSGLAFGTRCRSLSETELGLLAGGDPDQNLGYNLEIGCFLIPCW